MKKFISNKIVLRIIGLILFIIVWYLLSLIIGQSTFIFPSPIDTFIKAFELLKEEYTYKCIWISIFNMLKGFTFSFVIAYILGVICGNNEKIKEILSPSIIALKSIPTASLVYLFLMIAGIDNAPVYIVMLVCIPIIYEAVVSGMESIPIELIDAMKIDGCSELNGIVNVKMPLSLPYVLVGVASSFALSFKIEIMAEVITGSSRLGLGSAIASSQRSDPTNMVPVFAYSLIAIILMNIMDIIISTLKKKTNVV